jgi:SAM-dependent methyltransferase
MITAARMDPWYLSHLACPRDHGDLHLAGDGLSCNAGHAYPIVDGIPVMLLDDVQQTMGIAEESLRYARRQGRDDDLYLETLGISEEEKRGVQALAASASSGVDPVVAYLIAATNGLMYKHLIGTLTSYPIPELRLPPGNGHTLLDVGCNWGRWSIAAARKGYEAVGIDPSLGSILAAARVSRSLGLEIKFIVGDARYLPFRPAEFDYAFSYSVIQHLSRDDATRVMREIGRTLAAGGTSLVQMPTKLGIRCLYHQWRRGFRDGEGFEVRYWSVPALRAAFSEAIGPTAVSVDCYFGIGLQKSDAPLMTPPLRFVLWASESLRQVSGIVPVLKYVADSVYVKSVKRSEAEAAAG